MTYLTLDLLLERSRASVVWSSSCDSRLVLTIGIFGLRALDLNPARHSSGLLRFEP
jgi:hypothetical protein